MSQIDLSEAQHHIEVRPLTLDDIDAVIELQLRCFPKELEPWTAAHLRSQIETFPEGQIGVIFDDKLVATSNSLIVFGKQFDRRHTFGEACDRGYIRNHEPDGDALYGIDIAVDPDFRGMRLARRIYEARKELVRERNLRSILIAGRMPNYHRHKSVSPQAYLAKVLSKEIADPVVTAQLGNGFSIRSVLPDYLPSDTESKGYAVLMEWLNPYYVPDALKRDEVKKVRVAAVQYQMRPLQDFEDFCSQCEFFIDTAGDYRCDFLCFPELLTNQLQALVATDRPEQTARALDEFTKPYIDFFNRMAIKYNINIIGGTHLTVDDGKLVNAAYLFKRDGAIEKQYKIHITPAEARWWGVSPGQRLEVFDTDCGPIAVLICYDVEFPELARIAAGKGANILFIPFNTDIRSGYIRVRTCAQARAIENHLYCVLSGAVGNLPFVEGADIHYAQSCILTPSDIPFSRDGVAEEATPNVEMMLVQDLDVELLRATRRTSAVRPWHDRNREVYAIFYREGDQTHEI